MLQAEGKWESRCRERAGHSFDVMRHFRAGIMKIIMGNYFHQNALHEPGMRRRAFPKLPGIFFKYWVDVMILVLMIFGPKMMTTVETYFGVGRCCR